ncbi:ferritin-like domain-containing protein [Gordonia sp. DT219]|uniref:ferritin-like domain-containing protein n=1 Tax=Gordonia sp. DT219 TaxID=3416658 RepID=UPI003CEDCBB5
MTVSTTTIQQQLRTILALTNTEIQIAQTRQAQARTDAVRAELSGNAAKGRKRATAIEKALRERHGVADVVRPALGRVAASIKTLAEQAEPLDEALLGDLALEQELLSRATYLKALATGADDTDLVSLAQRLIDAHTETIEWINTVLAEEALGGPAALRRSPSQWVSGLAARAVTLPGTAASRGIDRAAHTLRQVPDFVSGLRSRVGETVDEVGSAAEQAGQSVLDAGAATIKTAAAGRDAALEAIEDNARVNGAPGVADALHSVRESTGIVDPDDLPIPDYADLNLSEAIAAIKDLDEPADVRVVLHYEEAHKNRQRVVSAAETRIAGIAKDVVGVE